MQCNKTMVEHSPQLRCLPPKHWVININWFSLNGPDFLQKSINWCLNVCIFFCGCVVPTVASLLLWSQLLMWMVWFLHWYCIRLEGFFLNLQNLFHVQEEKCKRKKCILTDLCLMESISNCQPYGVSGPDFTFLSGDVGVEAMEQTELIFMIGIGSCSSLHWTFTFSARSESVLCLLAAVWCVESEKWSKGKIKRNLSCFHDQSKVIHIHHSGSPCTS